MYQTLIRSTYESADPAPVVFTIASGGLCWLMALPSRISPNGLAVCSDAVLAAMVYVSSLVQMRCALCGPVDPAGGGA
jgi:hypothetical protein